MGEERRVRKHRVTIHVDESEKQKLDSWSMQAGLRREAYLRKVLLENTVPVSADQAAAARQLAAEMGRIGNNVNQIARVANQTQTVRVCQVNRMLEMLHELQHQVGDLTRRLVGDT